MSTDRIIIHADIAERFLEILKVTIINLAPSVLAPPYLVNAAAKSRLQVIVSNALSEGASSLVGDIDQLQPREGDGATPVIFAPMIIRGIQDERALWQDENFGPVAAYRIAKSDEEAIAIAKQLEAG